MEDIPLRWIMGQAAGLIALALSVAAFASKRDERLFLLLLFTNVAFVAQFAFFQSWVAAGISTLIVLRIALVRRFPGNVAIMTAMLMATLAIAALTWNGPHDIPALVAGILGTYAMFMLRGIIMRAVLAVTASCWLVSNLLAGSFGGALAELLMIVTNVVTMWRLRREALVHCHP